MDPVSNRGVGRVSVRRKRQETYKETRGEINLRWSPALDQWKKEVSGQRGKRGILSRKEQKKSSKRGGERSKSTNYRCVCVGLDGGKETSQRLEKRGQSLTQVAGGSNMQSPNKTRNKEGSGQKTDEGRHREERADEKRPKGGKRPSLGGGSDGK